MSATVHRRHECCGPIDGHAGGMLRLPGSLDLDLYRGHQVH
jgi:hypothetical protein